MPLDRADLLWSTRPAFATRRGFARPRAPLCPHFARIERDTPTCRWAGRRVHIGGPMPLEKVLVTHRTLAQALTGAAAGAATMRAPAAFETTGAGAEHVTMMAALSSAMTSLESEETRAGIFSSPRDPLASALQSYLAERAHDDPRKLRPVVGAPDNVLEVKYDEHDTLGWVGSFFTWWRKLNPHPWVDAGPRADPIRNNARVALLSDWGTGLYGAPVCAQSISRATPPADVVMH